MTELTTLTLTEYQNFVRGLESTAQEPRPQRLAHGALGLCTEWLEYRAATNTGAQLKEAGDMCYFATVIVDALGGSIEDVARVHVSNSPAPDKLIEAIGSEVKRRVFYYKSKYDNASVIDWCCQLIALALADCEYVLHINVAKLRQRYPAGKFNPDDAMARADEAVNPDGNKVA